MRDILAHSVAAIINSIAIIGAAETDSQKREVLVRQLASNAIEGINETKSSMRGFLYGGESLELDAVANILRKTYCSKEEK